MCGRAEVSSLSAAALRPPPPISAGLFETVTKLNRTLDTAAAKAFSEQALQLGNERYCIFVMPRSCNATMALSKGPNRRSRHEGSMNPSDPIFSEMPRADCGHSARAGTRKKYPCVSVP